MPDILFDCERMKYPNTGLFTFCRDLGFALLQKVTAVEKLYFFMPKKLGPYFGDKAGYIWQNSLQKLYLPHHQKIDVWHTTYQSSPYRSAQRQLRKVLTIHDLNFLHERKTNGKEKKLLAGVQRSIDDADQIVCISRYAKEEVQQYLNTRGKEVDVIYNGCQVQEFPGFNQPRYQPVRPFLFAMGTILPKKNFHVLPRLLAGQPFELVIAGNIDEAYLGKIQEEAKLHGVAEKVKVVGPVSAEEKYWYLHNCTAFCFPSLAEGFGLPAIEAMHFGKPVFLSDRTSLPEVGGDAAYYFHDFDPVAMQAVLEQGLQHYQQHQRAAVIRQHAAQFNWSNAADAYLHCYRRLY